MSSFSSCLSATSVAVTPLRLIFVSMRKRSLKKVRSIFTETLWIFRSMASMSGRMS